METVDDFAAEFFAPERPPRDSSGRPLLIPRGVEVADENRVAYTRASGLGDLLEEFSYLWKWKMRGLAKGLADSMDLIRLVAAEDYTCGFAEDEAANRQAGRNIDAVIERAADRAGVDMKADYGTAIHLRTEPGNKGTDPDEKQRLDQESCWELWRELGVVHLGTEIFTANDELRTAGTFDHLSYVPGLGIVVTDKKTSSKAKAAYDIQLADYAYSDVYDKDTDERMTLEEFIAAQGWNPGLLNRDVGIIWWVKNGKTQARQLDLVQGIRWARIAAQIRDERRPAASRVAKDVTRSLSKEADSQRVRLLEALTGAPTIDVLTSIWNNPTAQAIWTDQHTEAARSRKEAL
jgi:hypothetical protein